MVLDRVGKTGSVSVIIDATSVNTGHAVFNEHIQAADYFDTANHPTITFKSDKMTFRDDQPVSLEGDLTIKGVTQPVTLAITHFKCMPHPMLKVRSLRRQCKHPDQAFGFQHGQERTLCQR